MNLHTLTTSLAASLGTDRFAALSEPELMMEQACDPNQFEANLALNMEICDRINKQTNSNTVARSIAFGICKVINTKHPQAGTLACALLDCCVKNCGYPFHLVISTKEFLNELVKRFPDRPLNVGPVQYHILSLIGNWNHTLCATSRHKKDFKYINDMYRLLQYKGYRFSDTNHFSMVIPDDILKTEHELEEEDKVAHGAKLQELLRLGTPAALEQANELMKIMAGYDVRTIPDYKKMVDEELEKIQNKCLILSGILDAKTDRFEPDPTLDELQANVQKAQTRIQKMITNGENEERMEQLLVLNDMINGVLNNYDCFKSGTGQRKMINIPVASSTNHTSSTASHQQPSGNVGAICLIDFNDDVDAQVASTSLPTKSGPSSNINNLLGELSSVDFSSPVPLMNGNSSLISLANRPIASIGSSANSFPSRNTSPNNTFNNNLPMKSRTVSPNNMGMASQPMVAQQPPRNASLSPGMMMGQSSSGMTSLNNTSKPSTARSISPVLSGTSPKEAMLFNKNGLQLVIKYYTDPNSGSISGIVTVINTTTVTFTDLVLLFALPKSMALTTVSGLSNTIVAPLNTSPVTQSLGISNPSRDAFKLRFRVGYCCNGARVEEQGELI